MSKNKNIRKEIQVILELTKKLQADRLDGLVVIQIHPKRKATLHIAGNSNDLLACLNFFQQQLAENTGVPATDTMQLLTLPKGE